MKINWREVWREFETWKDKYKGRLAMFHIQNKIQQLVEKQLKEIDSQPRLILPTGRTTNPTAPKRRYVHKSKQLK